MFNNWSALCTANDILNYHLKDLSMNEAHETLIWAEKWLYIIFFHHIRQTIKHFAGNRVNPLVSFHLRFSESTKSKLLHFTR